MSRPLRTCRLLLLVWLLSAIGATAHAAPDGSWPPLPAGTRAVLFGTGGDQGYYFPKGCNGRAGGFLYRSNFERWFSATNQGLAHAWLATGELASPPHTDGTIPLAAVYESLARVPYAAAGVGTGELQFDVIQPFAAPGARRSVPLVATNLEVFETGRAPFERSRVIDVGGLRVLVLSVQQHDPRRATGSAASGTLVTTPPAAALLAELAARKGTYDRAVLLSAMNDLELRQLLQQVGGIDAVFATAGTLQSTEPAVVNGVPVLWLSLEGRLLGRLAFGADGQLVESLAVPVRGAFPIDPLTGRLAEETARPAPTAP